MQRSASGPAPPGAAVKAVLRASARSNASGNGQVGTGTQERACALPATAPSGHAHPAAEHPAPTRARLRSTPRQPIDRAACSRASAQSRPACRPVCRMDTSTSSLSHRAMNAEALAARIETEKRILESTIQARASHFTPRAPGRPTRRHRPLLNLPAAPHYHRRRRRRRSCRLRGRLRRKRTAPCGAREHSAHRSPLCSRVPAAAPRARFAASSRARHCNGHG